MFFRRVGELAARYRFLVLGFWVLTALLANVLIPQLSEVIKRDTVPFLPSDSAVMQAYRLMGEKFAGANAGGYAIAVLENGAGLSSADNAFYQQLVQRIRADTSRVVFVQDYIAHPEFKDAVVSKDGKAVYVPIGLKANVGTPAADDDAVWLRGILGQDRPADLTTHLTGDTAIIADFQTSIQESTARTTVVTALLLIVILLVIYRSPVTPLIPLATIGLSILVVRPVVALLGLHFIKVASFTETFILAIVFGAGTDYCIFLISRFKEQVARGQTRRDALATTSHRVGEAISSSAATVMVGGLAMSGANVALFSTTGPAIAAAVAVTLVAGLTLTPALIAIGGDRFFWPQRISLDHVSRFWTKASALIVARPRRVFMGALVPLVLLAAAYPTMRLTYDERGPQPTSNDNIQGLKTLDHHYQTGEILPDYVLLQSNHDLRNAKDLAAIDAATVALTHVDGVGEVRSFTQPAGQRIPQASVPYQAGQIGSGLGQARDQIEKGGDGLARLNYGAGQVASGAALARDSVDIFINGLARENSGLGQAASGSAAAATGAAALRDGAADLARGLAVARDGVKLAVTTLSDALTYLAADPTCQVPASPCQQAEGRVQGVRDAERDKLLPGLETALAGASQIAAGDGDLAVGLGLLHDGVVQALAGVQQLESGERTFKDKLGLLAGGAGQVSVGVAQIAAGSDQLRAGLGQAADYLNAVSQEAGASLGTFFVPEAQLGDPRLALARFYYLSTDGTTARLVVFGKGDPFGVPAMDRVGREESAVKGALVGSDLAPASIKSAGFAPQNNNLRDYFMRDFTVVGIAVLAGVLIVLILLLRSLVAPVYLLGSVLLSYAGAMGFTTLVWQYLLGKGAVDWTVPIFAFVMLVAVGADYNIFLMSRVREEVIRDPATGLGNAVRRTGAIITSAGVIFAGTFAALMTSPLSSIAETGFAITFGLLLDTFVVRSFLVPSLAAMLGRWNWWPHFGMKRETVEALEHTGEAVPVPVPTPTGGRRPKPQPAR